MTFTHSVASNNFGCAKWIVSANVYEGTHTTIDAALTSASSGDTIFIRPGTYTENLTLKVGVNLTAYGSDSSQNSTGKVIINGTCTLTTAGTVTISGIQLQTNSAALLAVTGSVASIVNLENCYLNITNASGITFSSSSTSSAINLLNCTGNLGTTGIKIFAHTANGALTFFGCNFSNSGASVTASTVVSGGAGNLNTYFSNFFSPFSFNSSSGGFQNQYSSINCQAINTTALAGVTSGTSSCHFSIFNSGTATAITVGAGASVGLQGCEVDSSNAAAISGAGSISYTGTMFLTTTAVTVTTQTNAGALYGIVSGANPTAGNLGETITSTVTSVSFGASATPQNLTSIVLTPGVWDINATAFFHSTSGGIQEGILTVSTVSATIQNVGSQGGQFDISCNTCTLYCTAFRQTLTAATTTIYLVGQATFPTNTSIDRCRISATRVG